MSAPPAPAAAPRLLRGVLAASLATAVALAGHLAAGAASPSAVGILVPWWLSVTVCTVLAGRRPSLPRTSVAVLASQVLFHALFTLGTPQASGAVLRDPPGSHLGHGGHGGVAHAGLHGATELGGHAAHAGHLGHAGPLGHVGHDGPAMLLGHLVAALVTALLLHRGEMLARSSVTLLATLLTALAALGRAGEALVLPVLVPTVPRRPLDPTFPLRRLRRAALTPQPHRGPPLVPAVA